MLQAPNPMLWSSFAPLLNCCTILNDLPKGLAGFEVTGIYRSEHQAQSFHHQETLRLFWKMALKEIHWRVIIRFQLNITMFQKLNLINNFTYSIELQKYNRVLCTRSSHVSFFYFQLHIVLQLVYPLEWLEVSVTVVLLPNEQPH